MAIQSSSMTHMKVLLKKDRLTLKRNWSFLVSFVLMPLFLMGFFSFLYNKVSGAKEEEKHNFNYTAWTKLDHLYRPFLNSEMSTNPPSWHQGIYNMSVLWGCGVASKRQVGFVSSEKFNESFYPHIAEALLTKGLQVHSFLSIDAFYRDVRANVSNDYCFGFEISDVTPKSSEINITYMFPRDASLDTYQPLYDLTSINPDWRNWNNTFWYGTPQFMIYVTDMLVLLMTGRRVSEIELAFLPYKTPKYRIMDPQIAQNFILIFPFFIICIFLLPLYYTVTKLAEEKEGRSREGMQMMGLREETYFYSWFLMLLFIITTTSSVTVLVSSVDVFHNTDMILYFMMCVLYGMTMYGFSFIIVAIFPTKKSSAASASLIHILSYYFGFMFAGAPKSWYEKLLCAMIPNAQLTFLLEHLCSCEFLGNGLDWEFAAIPVHSVTFYEGLIMLGVQVVVLAMLGYYLDQVLPKQFGVQRPWNFPCIYLKNRGKAPERKKVKVSEENQDREKMNKGNFEDVSASTKRDSYSLKVRDLRKVYDNGKVAVGGVSMTMYSGQIFALLGHNGAGKTTTISTLTGLLSPTEGQAVLDGVDVLADQQYLRENLGICPQHNVLFDYLTVREHIELYATFKGVDYVQVQKKVDKMLYQVELVENQHQLAMTLSGGQRRKLSVAIALIGDAKIIMLDEPTSGMDTSTRRRFWEMVKQYKENRIIILTTHYMDEADILGDRICIMAEGSVQCCGSSLFLKNRFGVGYNLVLAKKQGAGAKTQSVNGYIAKKLPEATLLQEVSTEITYQLPLSVSSKFKDFFASLDKDLATLGLGSYGVRITTLEEVFLSIGHGEEHATTIERIKEQTADLSKMTAREKMLTEYTIATDHRRSIFRQFLALVRKKLLVTLRDPKSFLIDFFCPMLLIYAGLYLSGAELINQDFPKRALSAYDYPTGGPLIYNQHNFNQTEDEVQIFMERNFLEDVGPGKLYSKLQPVDTDVFAHFFEQAKQIGDVIYDNRDKNGLSYGGPLFIQQASREDRYYSIGVYINATSAAAPMSYTALALQSVMRDLTKNPKLRLNVHEKPLPFGFRLQTYFSAGQSLLCTVGFAVAFMMVSDQMIQNVIKEREAKIKHQILVSGSSKFAYWFSSYFVDFLYHQLVANLIRLGVHCFGIDAPDIQHVYFWFSICNPIFVYAFSFVFDSEFKGSVFVRLFYFGFGAVAPITVMCFDVANPVTKEIAAYLMNYFRPWPIYGLNYAYLCINQRNTLALMQKQEEGFYSPLDWDISGKHIYHIQVMTVFSIAVLFIVELGFYAYVVKPIYEPLLHYCVYYFNALWPVKKVKLYRMKSDTQNFDIMASDDEDDRRNTLAARKFSKIVDSDPLKEESRVISSLNDKKKESRRNVALTISKLTKRYKLEEAAVENLSYQLEYGECFALLGVTGAGKSTTFKCLTGEEIPDDGQLYMGGQNVRTIGGFDKARCLIGYCPQFDAIFHNLTVKQHLQFYADIKGVRGDFKVELVDKQIQEMDLTQFTHVNAGELSGGNKRKLQCAIALIGNPPIVLLDEPSTGVDPQAKRFMWTIISNISTLRKQSTVVLTTHSMEEAEALCTKMGIMVDGQFKCFGSSQHIKDKYGLSFEIEVKIRPMSDAEITKTKEKAGVTSEAVSKTGLAVVLRKLGYEEMKHEIIEDGLGHDLHRVLTKTGKLYVDELMRWAHIERNGGQIITRLERTFQEFQLVEHFSNSFTFKVSRDQYSIGAVFGMLEEMKEKFSILEYSAQQTSLEQIFNVFAQQAGRKALKQVESDKKIE